MSLTDKNNDIVLCNCKLSEEEILYIMELDKTAYNLSGNIVLHFIQQRYAKCSDFVFTAREKHSNKLVGYAWYYPISKELKNELYLADTFDDALIPPSALDTVNKSAPLYLTSVVVAEAYRNKDIARSLVAYSLTSIEKTNHVSVLALAITTGGERALSKCGFSITRELKDKSKLMVFNESVKGR